MWNKAYYWQLKQKLNVRFEVLMVVTMNTIVFWDVIPCSIAESYQCSGGTCYLCLQSISCNVKKEAAGSSQTLVTFYHITWCHVPQDSNLQKLNVSIVSLEEQTSGSLTSVCMYDYQWSCDSGTYSLLFYLLCTRLWQKTENLYIHIYTHICWSMR
jgi:hypothetical protein